MEQSRKQPWVGVVFLPLLTLFAYGAAYAYEYGYTSYFTLPADVIHISLESGIRAAASISFAFLLAFGWTNQFHNWSGGTWLATFPAVRLLLAGCFALMLALCIHWTAAALLVLTLFLLTLRAPMNRLLEKFRRPIPQNTSAPSDKDSVLNAMAATLGLELVLFPYFSALALFFIVLVGMAHAANTTTFVCDQDNRLIIRRYAETVVMKEYDAEGRLQPGFYLVPVEELQNTKLTVRKFPSIHVLRGDDIATAPPSRQQ